MIIIGHPWIKSENFVKVMTKENIENTRSDDIVVLDNLSNLADIARYCCKNEISYAVHVETIKEAIFANALLAKYIIIPLSCAKTLQDVAQEYLFDTRILVSIEDENTIEEVALLGIDGVIFKTELL